MRRAMNHQQQPKRGYRHKPRALNTSDLYARDDFEQQQVNFEDDEDYYEAPSPPPSVENVTTVVVEQKECNSPPQQSANMVVDDLDDDWCVIGEEEGEDGDSDVTSEWSFADNLGTFLSAATRGQREKQQQVKPLSSTCTVNETLRVDDSDTNTPPHFDFVDEHWAHKQKGKQKVTARTLHGRKS